MNNRLLSMLLLSSLVACADKTDDSLDPGCEGGKCDTLEGDEEKLDSPCKAALFDKSGRGFLPERLADDALIKHVYMNKADGCPTSAAEIMAVLAKNDKKSCKGVKTSVISEQAQLNGTANGAGYRTITTRVCDGRPQFGLIFSMFGFDPDGAELPDGVEIIAFDDKNKVFNYYKEVGGKMGFFGSSTDYVTKGPGGPNLTDTRGCANCHTGGGLIMKELTNPWLHWEEISTAGFTTFNRRSPGAQTLIDNRKESLGVAADGPRLELEVIEPGNVAWNARRVQFMNGNGTVADVLKPLFCPVEVNIAATFNKRRVNHNFLVDPSLLKSLKIDDQGRINTVEATYDAMLAVTGSTVSGSDKDDVNLAFAFVGRSHADMDYVNQLVEAGIIDRGFADDVLMIDFTRQALSDDRCDLLEFAPTLTTTKRTPKAIRDGFLAKLKDAADGSAAAQLRAHFQARADGDTVNHKATVDGFLAKCGARQTSDKFVAPSGTSKFASLVGQSDFQVDAMKLRSLIRKTVMTDGVLDNARGSAQHAFSVFEFDDSLPSDDIAVSTSASLANPLQMHPDARLSPVDCNMVSEFVATAGAGGGGNAAACPGACGEFVNGATCQCDNMCEQFGNCCEEFQPVAAACPGAPFEFVQGAACQCDDQCAQFNNCCDGWQTVCLAN